MSLRYSRSYDCEDGDLLVEQSPFYVLPDFQSRNLCNYPLDQACVIKLSGLDGFSGIRSSLALDR